MCLQDKLLSETQTHAVDAGDAIRRQGHAARGQHGNSVKCHPSVRLHIFAAAQTLIFVATSHVRDAFYLYVFQSELVFLLLHPIWYSA